MIAAGLTTVALLFGALIAAAVLTWRRWAAEPARASAKIDGPTCYPRVKR